MKVSKKIEGNSSDDVVEKQPDETVSITKPALAIAPTPEVTPKPKLNEVFDATSIPSEWRCTENSEEIISYFCIVGSCKGMTVKITICDKEPPSPCSWLKFTASVGDRPLTWDELKIVQNLFGRASNKITGGVFAKVPGLGQLEDRYIVNLFAPINFDLGI